jgi:hypothetical protein
MYHPLVMGVAAMIALILVSSGGVYLWQLNLPSRSEQLAQYWQEPLPQPLLNRSSAPAEVSWEVNYLRGQYAEVVHKLEKIGDASASQRFFLAMSYQAQAVPKTEQAIAILEELAWKTNAFQQKAQWQLALLQSQQEQWDAAYKTLSIIASQPNHFRQEQAKSLLESWHN